MTHRTSVVALAVLSAGLSAVPALADKKSDAFYGAGYNICDARMLARSWQEDVSDVVAWAGDKILRDFKNQVDDEISQWRPKWVDDASVCPASDFYSEADIRLIADFWDESFREAKRSIALKLVGGEKDAVDWALNEAKNG